MSQDEVTYATISAEDVVLLVNRIQSGDFGDDNSEEQKNAMYDFASELTGMSIDSIFAVIGNISGDTDTDETVDDIPFISQEDVAETISSMQDAEHNNYSEDQMDAIYMFASELTGVSIDTLFEIM